MEENKEITEKILKEVNYLEEKQFHKASDFRGNVKVMVKSNVKDLCKYYYNLALQSKQDEIRKTNAEWIKKYEGAIKNLSDATDTGNKILQDYNNLKKEINELKEKYETLNLEDLDYLWEKRFSDIKQKVLDVIKERMKTILLKKVDIIFKGINLFGLIITTKKQIIDSKITANEAIINPTQEQLDSANLETEIEREIKKCS